MEFQEQEVAEAGVVRRPGSRPRSGSGSRSFLVGGSLLLSGGLVIIIKKKKKKKKKNIYKIFKRFWEGFGHFVNKLGILGNSFHVC